MSNIEGDFSHSFREHHITLSNPSWASSFIAERYVIPITFKVITVHNILSDSSNFLRGCCVSGEYVEPLTQSDPKSCIFWSCYCVISSSWRFGYLWCLWFFRFLGFFFFFRFVYFFGHFLLFLSEFFNNVFIRVFIVGLNIFFFLFWWLLRFWWFWLLWLFND